MKTYHGSCFCEAVAFEADGDLAEGTMRCNCRFCRKMRYWEMKLPDPKGFRLLRGHDHLAETPLTFPEGTDMHHWFCKTCGTRMWTEGNIEELGGHVVMVCINALDDVTVDELVAKPIHYANGADNDWWHPAPDSRHL